jgi:SAM-dependent methyltransferase
MGIVSKITDLIRGRTARLTQSEVKMPADPSAVTEPVQGSRAQVQEYWRTSEHAPSCYAEADPRRSEYLVGLLLQHLTLQQRILELGTNAGRNLHYLRRAGFERLEGIEISPIAVEELRTRFPELDDVVVHVGPMERYLRELQDDEFDCVYTMAVLEHVHYDSDWVFAEIARIAKTVVTIEEEDMASVRHFPRDYQEVFESIGMSQVFEQPIGEAQGLYPGITARVFVRAG